MEKEKSAGAVVFYGEWPSIQYLVLHRRANNGFREFYGFPRGKIEANETEKQAALREIKEETSLDVELVPGFRHEIRFLFKHNNKLVAKTSVFFLAKANTKEVRLTEHDAFFWLSFDEAIKKLRFKTQKQLLERAHHFLHQYFKQTRMGKFFN